MSPGHNFICVDAFTTVHARDDAIFHLEGFTRLNGITKSPGHCDALANSRNGSGVIDFCTIPIARVFTILKSRWKHVFNYQIMNDIIYAGICKFHGVGNNITNFNHTAITLFGYLQEWEDDFCLRTGQWISVTPGAINCTGDKCSVFNPTKTCVYGDFRIELDLKRIIELNITSSESHFIREGIQTIINGIHISLK